MQEEIIRIYGNNVRLRVCGLCWDDDQLLLVNHSAITEGDFWAPPGGGVVFGSTADKNLEREFLEETGLIVHTERFRFACEFIKPPLHAIELFFEMRIMGGHLSIGKDPEFQIIKDVRFLAPQQIKDLPAGFRHGVFDMATTKAEFERLSGFYRI